jgi:hypothetical protein
MMVVKRSRRINASLLYKTLCCVLVVSSWAGCKTAAVTTGGGGGATGAEVMRSEEAFFASVLDRAFRFHTLSARIKLEWESPQRDMSVRGQLKMIRNDCIQISLQPFLGVEAFRVELTGDSVKILDRLNKRYLAESYEDLKGFVAPPLFGFNFHNLQSLFTNNLFIPGESEVTPRQIRRFRITRGRQQSVYLKVKDETGLLYTFTADGGDERLRSASIRDRGDRYRLTWDYDDFQTVGRQRFPFKMKAGLIAGEQAQGSVTLFFSDAVVNRPLKTEFHVPAGYRQVTFSQIIKSLEK